jgi:hypothetical protein
VPNWARLEVDGAARLPVSVLAEDIRISTKIEKTILAGRVHVREKLLKEAADLDAQDQLEGEAPTASVLSGLVH